MTIMRPIAPAIRRARTRVAAVALVAVVCVGCASAGKVADKPADGAGDPLGAGHSGPSRPYWSATTSSSR